MRVTIGDSGLCCVVLHLVSAIDSLLLNLPKSSRPHSVSDYANSTVTLIVKAQLLADIPGYKALRSLLPIF